MHRILLIGLIAGAQPACSGPDPSAWSGPEDCRALSDVPWRDECFSQVAVQVFRRDRAEGEALALEVSDPLVRDYIYLAVTREIDPGSPKYCRMIELVELRARCEMLIRRPHLHRELVGEPPPGGAPPGGAPPGGAPPAGQAPPVEGAATESPPR